MAKIPTPDKRVSTMTMRVIGAIATALMFSGCSNTALDSSDPTPIVPTRDAGVSDSGVARGDQGLGFCLTNESGGTVSYTFEKDLLDVNWNPLMEKSGQLERHQTVCVKKYFYAEALQPTTMHVAMTVRIPSLPKAVVLSFDSPGSNYAFYKATVNGKASSTTLEEGKTQYIESEGYRFDVSRGQTVYIQTSPIGPVTYTNLAAILY